MHVEFYITIPVVSFRETPFKKRIQDTVERELDISQRLLEKTHRSWDTQVAWQRERAYRLNRYSAPSSILGVVWTDNDAYNLVAKGAASHAIRARRRPWLRYQENYRAKTWPRVIGSRAGGRYGEWVKRRHTRHPGSAAREFHLEISERRTPKFQKAISGDYRRQAATFFSGQSRRAR